jgi:hypothetical protein
VPRRLKLVADAWGQEAFDSERNEHSVFIALEAGCDVVCVGVCNYSAHRRETRYYTLHATVHVPLPSLAAEQPPVVLQQSLLRRPTETPATRIMAAANRLAAGVTPQKIGDGFRDGFSHSPSNSPTGSATHEPRRVSFGGTASASAGNAPPLPRTPGQCCSSRPSAAAQPPLHSTLGVATPRRREVGAARASGGPGGGIGPKRGAKDAKVHPPRSCKAESSEVRVRLRPRLMRRRRRRPMSRLRLRPWLRLRLRLRPRLGLSREL